MADPLPPPQNDPPPVPELEPEIKVGRIDQVEGPTWRAIAGGAIGFLVLVGFFWFALQSATNGSSYVCNSFFPLTVFFALGTALAGAFIGGEIGAKGTTPATPLGQLGYAAAGGIAGLIVVFVLSFLSFRSYCPIADASLDLDIQGIPANTVVKDLPRDFWVRKRSDSSFLIQFNPEPTQQNFSRLTLQFPKIPDCNISIAEYRHKSLDVENKSLGAEEKMYRAYWKEAGSKIILQFNSAYVAPDQETRLSVKNCLLSWSKAGETGLPIENSVVSDGILLGVNKITLDKTTLCPGGTPCDGTNGADGVVPKLPGLEHSILIDKSSLNEKPAPALFAFEPILRFFGVGGAKADNAFGQVVARLAGSDPDAAQSAKQQILADWKSQQTPLLAYLRDEKADATSVAALLDVLIAGINATQADLQPGGQIRDLGKPIEAFGDGDYANIVRLANASDATVRFQARRLLQRFPVDQFEVALKAVNYGALYRTICDAAKDDELKYVRYAALRYYYNRVADKMYTDGGLSLAQTAAIDTAYASGNAVATCLPPDLRIDAAQLDYGRAIVQINVAYNAAKGNGVVDSKAIKFSREFLDKVRESDMNYIYPQHIVYMNLFKDNVDWAEIAKGTKQIETAVVGGAGGLSTGTQFRESRAIGDAVQLNIWQSPLITDKADDMLAAGSISTVLAQTPTLAFVKYRSTDDKSWNFGWVPAPSK